VTSLYWDTSCILPLYIPEPDSAALAELAGSEDGPITSSQIFAFELLFAVNARLARRQISKEFAAKVQRKFMADVDVGRFLMIPLGKDLLPSAVEMAAKLAGKAHALEVRTLDGIHLATALLLGSEEIVTSDKRMRKAAEALGLSVLPTDA
jgi:predicted nucleic acid-binding protein